MFEELGFAGIAWMHAGMRGYSRIKFSLKSLTLEVLGSKRGQG